MKKQFIVFLAIIMHLASASCVALAAEADRQTLIDSLTTGLNKCKNPIDSIATLYNIFDLSSRRERAGIGEQIYSTAISSGDNHSAFDILRNLANVYLGNDSMQSIIVERVQAMPDSHEKQSTEAFVKLSRSATRAQKSTEKERQKYLLKLISEYTSGNQGQDLTTQIEQLFKVCIYLGASSQSGALLCGYMDELGKLIEQIPDEYSPLRNMYYVQADIIYSNSNQSDKAVAAGKKLLGIIQQLEKRYKSAGRLYRNYDTSHYLIYRRFLSNYKHFSAEDIDKYYTAIKALAKRNEDIAADLADNQRVEIYFLMANGRYDAALNILKKQIDNPNQTAQLTNLLKLMVAAADSVGDQQAVTLSSLRLNQMLQEYIELNANEHYNELRILYDINKIKAQNLELEKEHNAAEAKWHLYITFLAGFTILILLLLIVRILKSSKKTRHLADALKKANAALQEESDNLRNTQRDLIEARNQARSADKQKTDFIHNMSHEVQTPLNTIVEYSQLLVDFVDEDKRQYLQKYSQVILLSCDLLKTLIDDVFDIAALENGKMAVNKQTVSFEDLCAMPLESINKYVNPGVKIIFERPDSKLPLLNTDPARVEQVLINMLSNAAKFTRQGSITLSCGLTDDKREAMFTVTDTGPGIPAGRENVIFNRFEKLDPEISGGGLGLHICKLVAKLLGGDIWVDTSYKGGAKFVFTIPVGRA